MQAGASRTGGVAAKRRCVVAVDDQDPGESAGSVIRVQVSARAEIYYRPPDATSYYDSEVGQLPGQIQDVTGIGDRATTAFDPKVDAEGYFVASYELLVQHGGLLLSVELDLSKGPDLEQWTPGEVSVAAQDVAIGLIEAMS